MEQYRGTTILSIRRNGKVVIGGDGQVSMGNTVMKGNARKVRRLYGNKVIAGFAGGTADAFTLFERFEGEILAYPKINELGIHSMDRTGIRSLCLFIGMNLSVL